MKNIKNIILENHKYTDLVFFRINKKLKLNFNNTKIKEFLFNLIEDTEEQNIIKKWKNFYLYNKIYNIRITVNSFTYTIITVDKFNN